MSEQAGFSKNVLLVDTAVLSREITEIHGIMSERLNRKLPLLDMIQWLGCLTLDGMPVHGEEDMQVILVSDSPDTSFEVLAQPDLLKKDGMVFTLPGVGRFTLMVTHPAGFVDAQTYYADLLQVILSSSQVENLLLLPSESASGTAVRDALKEVIADQGDAAAKKVCLFRSRPIEQEQAYRQDLIYPSLAYVLKIHSDEL